MKARTRRVDGTGGRALGGVPGMRWVIGMAVLLSLAACEDRQTWRGSEAEIVGWWVEDVSHGLPRRADELRLVAGSACMARVAEWAQGNEIYGVRSWPRVLQARAQRLTLIQGVASQGLVVHTADGLLAPRPGIDIEESELVAPLVDYENHDRRELDAVILSLADAQQGTARSYLAAVRKARIELDETIGVRAWNPTTRSGTAVANKAASTALPVTSNSASAEGVPNATQ